MNRRVLAIVLALAVVFGMVSTTGLLGSFGALAAEAGYKVGDFGQYKTLGRFADLKSEMDGKESLIKGMVPGNAGLTNYYTDYNEDAGKLGQSTLAAVTDGESGDMNATSRFVLNTSVAKLVFDIGYSADITDFIISGSQYDDYYYCINQDTAIYVSNSDTNLIAEGNKVWSHVFAKGEQTADHYSLRIKTADGNPVTGRYVAFVINRPAEADQVTSWYSQLRIGEVAVYGAPTAGTGFTVEQVVDSAQLPEPTTQLNKGITAYRWDQAVGVNITTGNSNLTSSLIGRINPFADPRATAGVSVLSDGEVVLDKGAYVTSSSDTNAAGLANVAIPYAVADGEDTYFEKYKNDWSEGVLQTNASKVWRGYTTSDDAKYMFFDLGGIQRVDKVLLGTYRGLRNFSGTGVDSADALQAKYLNGPGQDSSIRGISVYVSNSLDNLFGAMSVADIGDGAAGTIGDDANTTKVCTVGTNTSTVSLVTLDESVTGRYVGVYIDAKAQGGTLSELGIYGKKLVDTTQLTTSNAGEVPANNLLATSAKKAGNTNNNSGPVANLYDGQVPGVNVDFDANAQQIVSFFASEGEVTTVTGKTVPKVSGMSTLTFQLTQPFAIDRVLVAGSVNDDTNFGNQYDNRHVGYYEVYVGDNQTDLYNEANRVLYYDNFSAPGLAQLHQLEEARTGSYIGFKVTAGAYSVCRLGELGVYGIPANVTQITADNVADIPTGNYLITATKKSGTLVTGTSDISYLSDGLIPTLNTAGTEKIGFSSNLDYPATAPNGVTAPMTAGMATVSFQLSQKTTITKLLVAGSPHDAASTSGYDNRHVRYYEVYVSNDYDTLFDTANRVLYYDNFSVPAIAQLHELKNPAQGTYVGFRLSGGQYTQARVAELGVYGYAPSATQITADNADKIPSINRLSSGAIKYGKVDQKPEQAGNGLINGINSDVNQVASFSVTEYENGANVPVKLPNGQTVAKTTGFAKVAYQLTNRIAIEQLLVAGSANDDTDYTYGGEKYDNRHVLYYEIYISDTYDELFASAHRVILCDNSVNPGLAQLHKLEQPVEGQYVGFKLATGAYDLVRVAELGVYGEAVGVTQITADNAGTIPTNNLLTAASLKNGWLAGGSKPIEKLSDGLIYGINSDANESVGFGLNDLETEAKANNGFAVNKTTGIGRLSFDLKEPCFISNLLVAGSAGDETDFGTDKVDNRHVRYYEIYVSNDFDTLYEAANLVLTYDNFTDPQLAQLFTVNERGRYVGFKLTAGAYNSARLGEVGVYGSSVRTTVITADNAASVIPSGNMLASAVSKPGVSSIDYLYDGLIGGVNSEDTNKVNFSGSTGTVTTANGTTVENTVGMATVTFQLAGCPTFDKVVFAGSYTDSTSFTYDGVACDNRHILYLEMYVGDDTATLYDESNRKLAYENFPASQLAMMLEIAQPATGRYVGFKMTIGAYCAVRVSELGVYGVSGNLLAGRMPTESFEVDARGIDNKTAITDANGTAGTGNTGALTNRLSIWNSEPLVNLTDGNPDTRGALSQREAPSVKGLTPDSARQGLYYDTPWSVLTYYLGGLTTIDEITVSSGEGASYYLSGVQYYASDSYTNLFTNESLLYTTGGERYTMDTDGVSKIPDVTYEANTSRHIRYKLNAAQQAKTYRYVAVVITRPYGLYVPGTTNKLVGYCQARISEVNVTGTLLADGRDFFTVDSSVGEITMQVGHQSTDDHIFFENTLGGFKLTESTASSTVSRYTNDNWLVMDGDTVFTLQMIDKKGNVIPETGDAASAVNGREVEFTFPSTAEHVQTMAVVEGTTLRRLYNSFPDKESRRIRAGALDYPTYSEWTDADGVSHLPLDNRDKAILTGGEHSLVYLRALDVKAVNRLNNIPVTENLLDFMGTGVNGVSAAAATTTAPSLVWLWVLCGVVSALLTAAATVMIVRDRRQRPTQQ